MSKRRFLTVLSLICLLLSGCAQEGPAESCEDGVYNGDFRVSGQQDLEELAGCTRLNGSLYVWNTELSSLAGLEALTSVSGAVEITGNEKLSSLDGLDGLEQIGACLQLSDNPALGNVDGLGSLQEVGFCVYIGRAFPSGVRGNDSLASLAGLASLHSVGGFMVVRGNQTLATLDGLDGLDSVGGHLSIVANDELTSIGSLENLRHLGEQLEVSSNALLPSCAAQQLAAELAETGFDGTVAIHGNNDEATCE